MSLPDNNNPESRTDYLNAYNHSEEASINTYEDLNELLHEDTIEYDRIALLESYTRAQEWVNNETFDHRRKGLAYFPNDFAHVDKKNHSLIIDLSFLELQEVLHITDWDKGVYWYCTNNDAIFNFDYLDPSPIPLWFIVYYPPCFDWYATIPNEISQPLIRYKSHEFTILYLTSHYQNAYELFVAAPTIFWLAVCTAKEKRTAEKEFLELIEQPSMNILEYCELPATMSALELINKVQFEAFNNNAHHLIKSLFKSYHYQNLSHHKVISEHLIQICCINPDIQNTQLFDGRRGDTHLKRIILECLDAAKALQLNNIVQTLNNCETLADIKDLYIDLMTTSNRDNYGLIAQASYSESNFKGTPFIIPIKSGIELIEESLNQRLHIYLYPYHYLIEDGNYYFYKLLQPERATLGLMLFSRSDVKIDQLLLQDGMPVSDETKHAVTSWLRKANINNPHLLLT